MRLDQVIEVEPSRPRLEAPQSGTQVLRLPCGQRVDVLADPDTRHRLRLVRLRGHWGPDTGTSIQAQAQAHRHTDTGTSIQAQTQTHRHGYINTGTDTQAHRHGHINIGTGTYNTDIQTHT